MIKAVVDTNLVKPNQVFAELQGLGNISKEEMYNVFNMGVGLVVVVDANDVSTILDSMNGSDHSYEIGFIDESEGEGEVILQFSE